VIDEVLWPLAFAYAAHRISNEVAKFAPKEEVQEKPAFPSPSDIPDDLMALAAQENEAWAQEQVVRVISEKYEELRDWNRVRRTMGIGVIDG